MARDPQWTALGYDIAAEAVDAFLAPKGLFGDREEGGPAGAAVSNP